MQEHHFTKRSTNANRSRISIRAIKKIGQGENVANPVKIIPSSSLIIIQNVVTISNTVCAHVGSP